MAAWGASSGPLSVSQGSEGGGGGTRPAALVQSWQAGALVVGRPGSRRMAGEGWWWTPVMSPLMERLSCVPSCRERRKGCQLSRNAVRVTEDTGLGGERSCGLLAALLAGLPLVLPSPSQPPQPPQRDKEAFPGSSPSLWPDWPHLPPPPGEPGTSAGGNGAWWRSEQGWGGVIAQAEGSNREGRGT